MDTLNVAKRPEQDDAIALIRRCSFVNPRQEAQRLNRILEPIDPREAIDALSFMFKNLPIANVDDGDLDDVMAGYALAIRCYPRWAIIEARNAFISGTVPDHKSSFAPNPAELGREIGRRVSDYQAKLLRVNRQLREAEEQRQSDDLARVRPWVAPPAHSRKGFYSLDLNRQRVFSHDQFQAIQRAKRLPVDAYWHAMSGFVMLPEGAALGPAVEGPEAGVDDFNLYPDRDEWHRLHAPLVGSSQ